MEEWKFDLSNQEEPGARTTNVAPVRRLCLEFQVIAHGRVKFEGSRQADAEARASEGAGCLTFGATGDGASFALLQEDIVKDGRLVWDYGGARHSCTGQAKGLDAHP